MFVVIGLIHALAVPAFRPLDEPRHVAYAVVLATGKLPTVRDPMPFNHLGAEVVRGSMQIAAANHPPLYYALVALPIKLLGAHGQMAAGVLVARCITLGLAAIGLVFAFRALRSIVPTRPDVPVVSLALTAITPAFVNCCAVVMNDALAFLAAAALYDAAFAILARGPTRKASVLFIVWLAVSALTRFTALLVFPPALLAVVYGFWLHAEGSTLRRLLRGAGLCAAALLAAAIVSGPFYYRNHVLYDDITGSKALLEELHRTPGDPFLKNVHNGNLWLDLLDLLFSRLAGGITLTDVWMPGRIVFGVAGVGLLVGAFRRRRKLLSSPQRNTEIVGAALVAWGFLCVTLPIFEFFARGGQLSPRYFFPMLWAPWFFVALGLSFLRARAFAAGAIVFLGMLCFLVTDLYLARLMTSAAGDVGIIDGFAHAGFYRPDICTAVALVLFGSAVAIAATRAYALAAPVTPGVTNDPTKAT